MIYKYPLQNDLPSIILRIYLEARLGAGRNLGTLENSRYT